MTRARALALLVAVLGTWCAPLVALAEDDPADAPPVVAEGEDANPPDVAEILEDAAPVALPTPSLEERVLANPTALAIGLATRVLPLGIGCALLVWMYLRRQEIAAGYRPAPEPVVLAQPFTLGEGLALFGLVLFGMVGLTVGVVAVAPELPLISVSLLVMSAVGLPLAVIVALRRRRTSHRPPPSFPRAVLLGLAGLCVGMVLLLPVAVAQHFLLQALGVSADPQEAAKKVLDGTVEVALQIALYGVLMAPLAEESLFRGVLYPAVRNALGGTRKAVWLAAIATSLLFAAAHTDAQAFAPLFALSLVLTWVLERTNSLAASVVLHMSFNLSSMLLLLALRS